MASLANFKNFIRHGKQARHAAAQPHGEPTTDVSTVTAQQQRHTATPSNAQFIYNDPILGDRAVGQPADLSAGSATTSGQRAAAPQATVNDEQASHDSKAKDLDPSVIQRIVAEERESQGKLPNYPGLEKWILLEKMGDGAFSNVYRARDKAGRYAEVAIKVVRKFEMNSNQGDKHIHVDVKKQRKVVERSNILKEVQIMRQLDHPSIVQLLEFSESEQYYFIVLELCPGGELFHQIVRLTYLSENLSRHVILQVAEALEYLHETAGVVHRDIKPENLLFYPAPFTPTRNPKPRGPDEEEKADEGEYIPGVGAGGIGKIKVADFGLSKIIWDSQTMTPCGTVGYTAPEIVKDERYSKSVDMWALGCVLYTLLCGFPPFYDESIQALTEKVARGQYTFLSPWWDDISKSAQDLVSHLLTVDPDKRYTIKQFLNHPWIKQSLEETDAAADAPPLATPLHFRHAQYMEGIAGTHRQDQAGTQPLNAAAAHMAFTPDLNSKRNDFRSPGAVNLREVFDVSYAVHRAEEEGKRRKNFPQGFRVAGGLNPLNEDESDEDSDEPDLMTSSTQSAHHQDHSSDISSVERQMRGTTLSARSNQTQQKQEPGGYGQHSAAVAAAARQQVRDQTRGRGRTGRTGGMFELSLDNATLLGRRGNAGVATKAGTSKLREQVV